jgi:hypothetical protein
MNNDIEVYGEDCIRIIRDYLLNLGLEHSNFKMAKDGGIYTNLQTQIKVDYTITKWTEFGMPEEIVADTVDMEGGNLPVTWRNIINYTENNETPGCRILLPDMPRENLLAKMVKKYY